MKLKPKHALTNPMTALAALVIFGFLSQAPGAPTASWRPGNGPLKTQWAKDVTPEKVHREYPRPQMVRKEWKNLNGLWEVAVANREAGKPEKFNQSILVPFPIESALSGVMKMVKETDRIWYRRTFEVPDKWRGRRVMLNFGAVDFEAVVIVNGKEVAKHRGGYDAFSCDITEALSFDHANELVVAVWDPTDAGTQPRGKQIRNPHGIWYTPTSGIWQTVWLEPVSSAHIRSLRITPDIDKESVTVEAATTATLGACNIHVVVRSGMSKVYEAQVSAGGRVTLPVKNPKLWTPESPYLYDLEVSLKLGKSTLDSVRSYFGMRKISLGKDGRGFTRLMLNNKPYFQLGLLDQGFWPDGLYTAPTDEALRYDIEMTKKLGFNMARKHVKIEPDRWYYWCDKLGLLVWQDMPSGDKYIGGNQPDITRSPESAQQFEQELTAMVQGRFNHPCIVIWVPYNEGWGQWDTPRIVEMIKKMDPSRLVINASGWTDRAVGDIIDMHMYPGPGAPNPEPGRASVLGEFGGLGLPVRGHTWQSERNWGYRSFTTADALTGAYIDLMARLFPLTPEKGLSAAVYTQTTDVEVEVNGLMTYDRILKMDAKTIANANRGIFPPRPRTVDVVPSAKTERTNWKYTTTKPGADWFKPGFDASSWNSGNAGFGTRTTPGSVVRTEWTTEDIWLRRDFALPSGKTENLRLLVHHDEDAEIYINGVLAAELEGFTTDYGPVELRPEARSALKPAGNILAVHCWQTGGGQYIDVGLVRIEPPARTK